MSNKGLIQSGCLHLRCQHNFPTHARRIAALRIGFHMIFLFKVKCGRRKWGDLPRSRCRALDTRCSLKDSFQNSVVKLKRCLAVLIRALSQLERSDLFERNEGSSCPHDDTSNH